MRVTFDRFDRLIWRVICFNQETLKEEKKIEWRTTRSEKKNGWFAKKVNSRQILLMILGNKLFGCGWTDIFFREITLGYLNNTLSESHLFDNIEWLPSWLLTVKISTPIVYEIRNYEFNFMRAEEWNRMVNGAFKINWISFFFYDNQKIDRWNTIAICCGVDRNIQLRVAFCIRYNLWCKKINRYPLSKKIKNSIETWK